MEYDVFLSYSSPDAQIVKAIGETLQRQGLAVFVDSWRLTPGAPYHPELMTALEASRAVAICIGASPPRDYHRLEINAAVARQVAGQTRVIPVLLPGGDLAHLGTALGTHNAIQFRGPEDREAMWRLARGIQGRAPEGGPPEDYLREAPAADGGTDLPATDKDVDEAVGTVAGWLSQSRNATFFVGGRAMPDPTEFEVTERLLTNLKLAPGKRAAPSPTLNTAATYYALSYGPQLLESEVAGLIIEKRDAASQALQLLAKLLKYMMGRNAPERRRPPPLIVTTCLDVGIERALLRAGVSFVRLVQPRPADPVGSRNPVIVNEYVVGAGPDGARTLVGWDCGLATMAQLDDAIEKSGYRELDTSPAAARHNEQGWAICSPGAPILYKFHGSHDIPKSCTLSTDHYLRSGTSNDRVPAKVLGIVAETPPLILGYGPADPAFRHMYLTMLRDALVPGTGYMVWAAPRQPNQDPYDRVDARLRGLSRNKMGPTLGVQVLPTSEVAFLTAVLQRLGVDGA